MNIPNALYLHITNRLDRQMESFPPGFPADRNGIRLGLAAIEDELNETLTEWRADKSIDETFRNTYDELLDVISAAIYTAVELSNLHRDKDMD